jgi:hypothetical protein
METRFFLPNELDSQKEKERTKPEKREKNVWPNTYQTKSHAAYAEEYPASRLNNHPGDRVPVFERQCEAGKGAQPFIGAKYRRKHGGKCDGGIEEIFEMGRFWKIHVMPILHILVEIFKGPPKSCTEQKQLATKEWAVQ